MSEKKKVISVMIPTYNEEENARPIYEAVRDEIRKDQVFTHFNSHLMA